jgi:hypothetical protein
MIEILLTAAALAVAIAPAMACDPPQVGDQYKSNGQVFEVVKVNSATCYFKLCVRPVGSKQDCRWIKDPSPNVTWIIEYGAKQ